MYVTVYPNFEVRSRIASPVEGQRKKERDPSILVNRYKLATISETVGYCPVSRADSELLDSSEAKVYPRCAWPRRGYGGTPTPIGFSPRARKTMARAGGVFSPASSGLLCFLTGTLPGSTPAAIKAMSDYSAWFVHELLQKIPRVLDARARDLRWMWCYEWQERGALHWHAVFEAPDIQSRDRLISEFREIWISTLRGLQAKSGVDVAERSYGGTHWDDPSVIRVDAQVGVASPQQYMASYLSKDDSKGGTVLGPYPSRWYQCSRRILAELREQTVRYVTREDNEHWKVEGKEIETLNWLYANSCAYRAFPDKVGSGFTHVHYLDEVAMKLFEIQIVGNVVKTSDFVDRWFAKNRRETDVDNPKKVEYLYIVWCGRDRALMQDLWYDLPVSAQYQLAAWVNGQEFDAQDLDWINWRARRLLERKGIIRSVKGAERRSEPLTEDPAKSLENGGVAEQLELYPGMP